MSRPLPPLLLTAPTRFATLERSTARWVCALLALLLLFGAVASLFRALPHTGAAATDDLFLHESVVAAVRAGGDYYTATATAMRAAGPVANAMTLFRLPALALVEAWLPAGAEAILLVLVAAIIAAGWYHRLRRSFARPAPRLLVLVLALGGMTAVVRTDLASFHQLWAGMLIALSLLARLPGRWIEAVALGMIAMLLEPVAALYVAIMALLAGRDGARSEAIGWGIAMMAFAAVFTLHYYTVRQVAGPLDMRALTAGTPDPGLFITAMLRSTALGLVPAWGAAPLVILALFGWAAWREPLARRVLVTIGGYAVLMSVFGRADPLYCGLMIAPLLLIGLAFVPDAVRDLVHAALDRRRIVVTRIAR